MEKRQIVVIAVVGILIVCGAAYALASSGDEDVETPNKGGWYSWNPKTFVCASSNVAPSPYWTNTLTDLYGVVYDSQPDFTKYTSKDVPEDYLTYDSLVSHDADGNLVIEGKYRDSAKVWQSYYVTIDKDRMPTGAIGAGSYFVCIYYLLCSAAGVDPDDHDSKVVSQLWDLAFGGDQTLFQGLETNYGIPVDGFHGTELPNPAKVNDNKDLYTRTVEEVVQKGEVPIWICSGSSPGWDNGGRWMKDMIEAQGGLRDHLRDLHIQRLPGGDRGPRVRLRARGLCWRPHRPAQAGDVHPGHGVEGRGGEDGPRAHGGGRIEQDHMGLCR